jgi:hypothetical protein
MAKVFPKVTKCTFHKYGPSGTVEKKDGLCVLVSILSNSRFGLKVFGKKYLLILDKIRSKNSIKTRSEIRSKFGLKVFGKNVF